jgi:hypothetical protein
MAVLGLLAACSSDPHLTLDDGPPAVSFTYELDVWTGREPPRTDPPTVYIDGVATPTISTTYPSAEAAEGATHLVELRYADQVIASYPVTVHAMPFCSEGPVVKRSEGVAEYESGDLRQGGIADTLTTGSCHGDPTFLPNCQCSTDERCGLRVMRDQPLFTHLACTPMGTKQVGEACSLTPDPGGAYDDCADDLICYQGACRAPCERTPCATTCVQPDGYPYEATVCM